MGLSFIPKSVSTYTYFEITVSRLDICMYLYSSALLTIENSTNLKFQELATLRVKTEIVEIATNKQIFNYHIAIKATERLIKTNVFVVTFPKSLNEM